MYIFLTVLLCGDDISKTLREKVQKLQNRTALVITRSSHDISSCSLLDELNWDTMSTMSRKQKSNLMFITIHRRTPLYLQQMFSPRENVYNLRDSQGNQVEQYSKF